MGRWVKPCIYHPSCHPMPCTPLELTPTNGANSGGTGRGLAPGMGSEMTRLDLEVDRVLGRMEPLLLATCCISCTARSGILLGSAHACCHSGSFCASRSLPCREAEMGVEDGQGRWPPAWHRGNLQDDIPLQVCWVAPHGTEE